MDWLYDILADIYYRFRRLTGSPLWYDHRIFFLNTEDDEEERLWRVPWLR